MAIAALTSPDQWLKWFLLGCATFFLFVVGSMVTAGDEKVVYVPLLFLVLPVAWYVIHRPALNLAVLLLLFVMAAGTSQGIGGREILFGLYYVPYLVLWYVSRLLVYRESIILQRGDFAVLLFGFIVVMALPNGLIGGGTMSIAVSELANFSLLAFYFPFREMCIRHRHAAWWLMLAIVVLGMIAAGRNMMSFASLMGRATAAWEIAGGRISTTEVLLFGSSVAAATALVFTARWQARWIVFGAFLLCTAGLVLTQFRAYYLALLVSLTLLFVLLDRERKLRLFGFGVVAGAGFALAGFLILGDAFNLLVLGVFNRVLSIGSAGSTDISFINRFYEYQAVIELIRNRPIAGYGLGAEFGFYDAIFNFTWDKPFVHNGFLYLWYKMGFFGMAVFAYLWILAARRGLRVSRTSSSDRALVAPAVFVFVFLVGLAVSSLTSTLFNSDSTMLFAMAFAMASGLSWRAESGATESTKAPVE